MTLEEALRRAGELFPKGRWPRHLAKAIAKANNWFWLPCPICGNHFAGFEWYPAASLPIPGGNGLEGYCDECFRNDAAALGGEPQESADYRLFIGQEEFWAETITGLRDKINANYAGAAEISDDGSLLVHHDRILERMRGVTFTITEAGEE